MKLDWEEFLGHALTISLHSNYGVVHGRKKEDPDIYEQIIKTGTLIGCYDEGLLLESVRDNQIIKLLIPMESVKLIEIH